MAQTSGEKSVGVEVSKPSIKDGVATLYIQKIWGSVELLHRGNKLFGGMTWLPDGELPVGFPVGDETVLTPDQAADLFSSLVGSLLPSVKLLVEQTDEQRDDF